MLTGRWRRQAGGPTTVTVKRRSPPHSARQPQSSARTSWLLHFNTGTTKRWECSPFCILRGNQASFRIPASPGSSHTASPAWDPKKSAHAKAISKKISGTLHFQSHFVPEPIPWPLSHPGPSTSLAPRVHHDIKKESSTEYSRVEKKTLRGHFLCEFCIRMGKF